jgi:putative ABC transport system substrate-binding protein
MRRRTFIALIGAAATSPPPCVRANPQRLPTIGFLGPTAASAGTSYVTAFAERLQQLGWIEDETVTIEYRWAEGHPERFAEIARDLVRLCPM